jgi:hypothetical protein
MATFVVMQCVLTESERDKANLCLQTNPERKVFMAWHGGTQRCHEAAQME